MSDPSRPHEPKTISQPGSDFDTQELRAILSPQQPESPAKPPEPPVTPPRVAHIDPDLGTQVLRVIHVPQSPELASPPPSDGYELEGGPLPGDDLPEPVPIPIPAKPVEKPKAPPRQKPKLEFERVDPEGSSEFEEESAEVDEAWSRWAEWGSDLIRIGAVGLGSLVLAWLTGSFLILVLGIAAMVILSYPILITLERPVRVTPEHAVTDFFAAASHHFPHYRRMWLLLSNLGRDSGRFATFDEFRSQWKGRIEGWKKLKGAGKFTPLKFEVENFRSDKSTDKDTARADYTVAIFVRGREREGPIETFRMVHGLVKGPDRMWYLNKGVLGNRAR